MDQSTKSPAAAVAMEARTSRECDGGSVERRHTVIQAGNRAVVVNQQDGHVWANLYVNARNGLQDADITLQRWTGKTLAGAQKWAARVLA